MPVQMRIGINRGWKASENNRFGQCLEVQFVDSNTGKLMFVYAPLLKDKFFWGEVFGKLESFDKKHKDLINWLREEVDGTVYFGKSDACKIEDGDCK